MCIPARQIAATAAAAAFLLGPGAAFAGVKEGVDAWQAGNYAAAVREWRPLADQGDPDAEFNLGQGYKLGRGVPADMRAAQVWYEKAAQQGHAQAQANLGLILFQNGERGRALPWIRKAADAGDPRAQYVLGTALFNGDLPGVGKDWPRAYALMSRAAAQGLPQAANNLTQMDRFVPLAQRRQGLALAQQMERAQGSGPPPPRPAATAHVPAPRPGPAVASAVPAPRPPVRTPAPPPGRPAPAPVRPVPAPVGGAGGWRIQLGAFGSAANAQKAWAALRGKAPALAGLRPVTVPAGPVTRLQAGPLPSRAAADKACAAVKATGAACFPVAP
ncbi:MAG: sel1 repeat family protein [Alphaproteobacteria bacterium]|nr:sel1 repeat family protein [Alphaproteobacteria bacterium]